jgi:hypothetical protein
VIAVVSSTVTAVQSGTTYGQNLNFGVPAAKIFGLMANVQNLPVEAFAEQTVPEGERRWRALEASLPEIEKSLPDELGARLAAVYTRVLREAIKNHKASALQNLLAKRAELRDGRETVLQVAENLTSTGPRGGRIAKMVLSAWEELNLNPTEGTKSMFDAAAEEARAYYTVRANTAKYGQPTFSQFTKGEWLAVDFASYGANTSFNWYLKGGRIRVGRLSAAAFVGFIKSDRDNAISSSF